MAEAQYTGERLSGGGDGEFSIDMERHLAAYRYIASVAAGKRVLDAGCGEGYGTALLAQSVGSVVGVDRIEPVTTARARHKAPNLEYRVGDMTQLDAIGEQFDVVVSCQVIEHLTDPVGFLRGLAGRVRPGGRLIVTTPNRKMTMTENPYHLQEWTAPEMLALAKPVLPGVEVQGMQASARVLEYEYKRGEQIQRILRLDPLGIRNLLPGVVVRAAFAMFARVVRQRVGAGTTMTAGPEDFHVGNEDMDRCLDLVVLATVPGPTG